MNFVHYKTLILSLSESQNHRCAYCHLEMTLPFYQGGGWHDHSRATIDHVIPKSRGGSHGDNNLVAACDLCNKLKSNFVHYQLFADLIGGLMNNETVRKSWHNLSPKNIELVKKFIWLELRKHDEIYLECTLAYGYD